MAAPAARTSRARAASSFGLSGGIDSAVVARLCQAAAPANVVGVLMPCHSDPQDEADARLVADHFQIPTIRVDLAPTYDALHRDAARRASTTLPPEQFPGAAHATDDVKARVPMANVKPRLRMTTLYFVANTLNYMVAGTGNRSELSIGYFTKYGDGGVDLLPIGDLLKSEVRAAARELGVPDADHRQGAERRALARARPTKRRWASPTPSSRTT